MIETTAMIETTLRGGECFMKAVTLVELATFAKIVPLASGCLWSHARADPEIAEAYRVRIYRATS